MQASLIFRVQSCICCKNPYAALAKKGITTMTQTEIRTLRFKIHKTYYTS